MGKLTYKGLVPPDDPMFSSGPEMFSRSETKPSSPTSESAVTAEIPSLTPTHLVNI